MTATIERLDMAPRELRNEGFQTIQALTAEFNRSLVMDMSNIKACIGGIALGSLLLEGGSGEGKTLAALTAAQATGGTFVREQGTADKLPSDYTGGMVYNPGKQEFEFDPGVLLSANFYLADEYNRNSEKGQSGLLEAFGEGQVTVAGVTHKLQDPFTVYATQNLQNENGTNPLPRASLDRYAISIDTTQTDEEQSDVLDLYLDSTYETQQVVDLSAIRGLRKAIKTIEIPKEYRQAIMRTVKGISEHPMLDKDDSIVKGRAKLRVADLARFHALSRGKQNVDLQDIWFASQFVFPHRIVTNFRAEKAGIKPMHIVQEVIQKVR